MGQSNSHLGPSLALVEHDGQWRVPGVGTHRRAVPIAGYGTENHCEQPT